MFYVVAIALIIGCEGASIPLLSPLVAESERFPTRTGLSSPMPARLIAQASDTSPSNDASPGPTDTSERNKQWSTINIYALDQVSQKHLIEKQRCNLLIIQDHEHYTKLNCDQNCGIQEVAFYFSAVDKAFAYCLEFLKLTNDPAEFDKDWYLIPFMRSLTDAIDRIPQECQKKKLREAIQAERPLPSDDRFVRESWNFMVIATMSTEPASNTPIPIGLRTILRTIVVKIWRTASAFLFKMKMDELITLVNQPMFKWVRKNFPPPILKTANWMGANGAFDNFLQPLNVKRPCRRGIQLIKEWVFVTQFKGDLGALRRIVIQHRLHNNGHLVLNLLPRRTSEAAEFDFVRTGLLEMGFVGSNINVLHQQGDAIQ